MKSLSLALIAGLALVQAVADQLNWLTDLPKAQALAKKEGKMVLLNFTGSDWCGFCIKLRNEVFTTSEFGDYARKNLVLVELDFPTKKQLPEALKKANKALAKQYEVRGYPTLVVLDREGKKLGQTSGYGGGGPKVVIEKLDKFKTQSMLPF